MNTDSKTKRRDVFYSMLILATTISIIVAVVMFILSLPDDRMQYFLDGIWRRLSGRLRI